MACAITDLPVTEMKVRNFKPNLLTVSVQTKNLLTPTYRAILELQENVLGWQLRPPKRNLATRRQIGLPQINSI
jgi:hypothetical protein